MAHPQTSSGYPSLEEIKSMIESEFPDADTTGIAEEKGQIFGSFVWSGFTDIDISDRNRMVSEKIRFKLRLRALNIGLILPLAPGEKARSLA